MKGWGTRVGVVAALVVFVGGGALSTPAGAAAPRTVTYRIRMTIVRFDRAVARANGYRIVRLPDGRLTSVKRGSGIPEGRNTVPGDCGSSYLTLASSAPRRYSFLTGFHVNYPAVSYHWTVNVARSGTPGVNFTFGGNLAFRHDWAGSGSRTVQVAGTYYGAVSPPSSWALLKTGAVCYSGGPTDSVRV
jgi:hypothetical protein